MNSLIRSGVAGFLATVPMTLVIFGGRTLGLLRTPPPVQITANVQRRLTNVEDTPEHIPEGSVAKTRRGMGEGLLEPWIRRVRQPVRTGCRRTWLGPGLHLLELVPLGSYASSRSPARFARLLGMSRTPAPPSPVV
jgi:hypothetical protein